MNKVLLFIFSFIGSVLMAQGTERIDTFDLQQGKNYFTAVDKMPVFPGCEMIQNKDDRFSCTEIEFVQYIERRISYQKQALDMGCEGFVYISLIINTEGLMSNIEVIRDQNPGCGLKEEALKIVRGFNNSGIKWAPGEHNGEEVNVKMVVPITFGTKEFKKQSKNKK